MAQAPPSPELLDRLSEAFGFGPVSEVTRLGGTRNENYLLTTSSGKWFVRRRYAGYCAPERIAFDHAVARFLHDRGVPVHPPRLTETHETWVSLDDRTWEVFPFVPGAPLQEAYPEDCAALGEALSRFHREGASFPERLEKLSARGEMDPALLKRQADTIERKAPACTGPLEPYRACIEQAETDLPDERFQGLPHTLVHGDLQPANLLIENGRIAAFVDLDWCGWQPRIYDLAYALLFCCARHAAPIQGGDIWSLTQPARLEPGPVRAFLDAYAEDAGSIPRQEREALAVQMRLTWCHCRIAGALKVPADERAAFLAREPAAPADLIPAGLLDPAG